MCIRDRYNITPAVSTSYLPSKVVRILRGNDAGTILTSNLPTGYSTVGNYNAHGKSIAIIDAPITTVGNQDTLTVPHSITNTPYRTSSIVIRGINNPPTQGNESATFIEDIGGSIAVLANNPDPDGHNIAISSFAANTSQGGSITVSPLSNQVLDLSLIHI